MDVLRNPYSPGAGAIPPALTGRDVELALFAAALERAELGLSIQSPVLVGLRGVGKTVLLNAFRDAAEQRHWGAGKVEGSSATNLGADISQAMQQALRGLGRRAGATGDRWRHGLAVLRAFRLTFAPDGTWGLGVDVKPAAGYADSGSLEVDLPELFVETATAARELGTGVALFVDEMQEIAPADLKALCTACHEITQRGLPLIVAGAGLPHLPSVLADAQSYAERLYDYRHIDRLSRDASDLALTDPAARQDVQYEPAALDELARLADGYPFFIQSYGKAAWDAAGGSPITASDVQAGESVASTSLRIGFFGSRWDRATPAEQRYMQAVAETGDDPAKSSDVARLLKRAQQGTSPTRDNLIKKGLLYAPQRGQIAFTVPHFAAFIRSLT